MAPNIKEHPFPLASFLPPSFFFPPRLLCTHCCAPAICLAQSESPSAPPDSLFSFRSQTAAGLFASTLSSLCRDYFRLSAYASGAGKRSPGFGGSHVLNGASHFRQLLTHVPTDAESINIFSHRVLPQRSPLVLLFPEFSLCPFALDALPGLLGSLIYHATLPALLLRPCDPLLCVYPVRVLCLGSWVGSWWLQVLRPVTTIQWQKNLIDDPLGLVFEPGGLERAVTADQHRQALDLENPAWTR